MVDLSISSPGYFDKAAGTCRAVYYFDTHPDDPHPIGEWALIYEQELELILPSLHLKWNRRRSE